LELSEDTLLVIKEKLIVMSPFKTKLIRWNNSPDQNQNEIRIFVKIIYWKIFQ